MESKRDIGRYLSEYRNDLFDDYVKDNGPFEGYSDRELQYITDVNKHIVNLFLKKLRVRGPTG